MGYKDVSSILDIGGGVVEERFFKSLEKVLENIDDPATEPTNVRKITLDFIFKPDKDRGVASIQVVSSEKLAKIKADELTVLFDRNEAGKRCIRSKEPEKQLELNLGEVNVQ